MLLAPGTLIADRYVVERKIGEGSWGEVWAGRHARVGMKVAIKVLLDTKAGSYDAITRFKREGMFLGRVHSDHVARVLDFIDDEIFGLVLVMEFIDGESLAEVLKRGAVSVEDAIDIACDLVAGLSDLHAARIVHRDMKPANVILRPLPGGGRRAVIIDFTLGRVLARPGEAEPSITQLTGSKMVVGTVPYMAPEQILDSRKVTEATDVYAVGAMLFRSISGRHVFEGRDEATVARRKLAVEAPKLDTGRDDAVGQEFERIVGRALRRRPEDRYTTARAMLSDLLALRATLPDQTTNPRMTHPATPPAPAALAPEVTVDMSRPSEADHRRRPRPLVFFWVGAISILGVGVALGVAVARFKDRRVGPVTAVEPTAIAAPAASSVRSAAVASATVAFLPTASVPAADSNTAVVYNLDEEDGEAPDATGGATMRAAAKLPPSIAVARAPGGDAAAPYDSPAPARGYAADAGFSANPGAARAVDP